MLKSLYLKALLTLWVLTSFAIFFFFYLKEESSKKYVVDLKSSTLIRSVIEYQESNNTKKGILMISVKNNSCYPHNMRMQKTIYYIHDMYKTSSKKRQIKALLNDPPTYISKFNEQYIFIHLSCTQLVAKDTHYLSFVKGVLEKEIIKIDPNSVPVTSLGLTYRYEFYNDTLVDISSSPAFPPDIDLDCE